jgi:dienelactone hydrolase
MLQRLSDFFASFWSASRQTTRASQDRLSAQAQMRDISTRKNDVISSEFTSLPQPTGPYRVGVYCLDLFDTTRPSPEWPHGRLVPLWIYFPIGKEPQKQHQKPIEKRAFDGFGIIPKWEKLNISSYSTPCSNLNDLRTSCPVILFNHGNSCLATDSSFLNEELASHGYIVISIQHQLFSDICIPEYLEKRSTENWSGVIRNLLFVFQYLQQNSASFTYFDLARVGLIGYSMGAHALALLSQHTSYGYSGASLLPHNTKNFRECLITLDCHRIQAPVQSSCPLFMLNAGHRKAIQKKNGEYCLLKQHHHRIEYYPGAIHASFCDMAYLNMQSEEFCWFEGSTNQRLSFFNTIRLQIVNFLQKYL